AFGNVGHLDPQGFAMKPHPVIAHLAGGRLVCVFSVYTAEKPAKMKIASSISGDDGKTWSQPAILFDHPNAEDADPNLLVDGERVLAFSTTVPMPVKIARSLIY